jgi:hypothetical protein
MADSGLGAFKERHGMVLAESYCEFLLRDNGGGPQPSVFPMAGHADNPVGVVQAMFGLFANIGTEDLDFGAAPEAVTAWHQVS